MELDISIPLLEKTIQDDMDNVIISSEDINNPALEKKKLEVN
jgi:hypothetical protein